MNQYPYCFDDKIKGLVGKLVKMSPKERTTIQEIKNHPWFVKNFKNYYNNEI